MDHIELDVDSSGVRSAVCSHAMMHDLVQYCVITSSWALDLVILTPQAMLGLYYRLRGGFL